MKPVRMKDYNKYPFMNLSLKDLKGEKWKDIPGFDGNIKISNYGRVWSLKRLVESTTGQRYYTKERILRQVLVAEYNAYTNDYTTQLTVHVGYQGKLHDFRTNRLVYDLFVSTIRKSEKHLVVAHKDGENCNNYYKNLILLDGKALRDHLLKINRRKAGKEKVTKPREFFFRPIVQYTLAGKKVAEFKSVAEAAVAIKTARTSIRDVAKERAKQLKGFVYRYKGDTYTGEYADFSREKEVTQYSIGGKKLATYPSVKHASVKTGIDANTISKCALRKFRIASGFVWRYQKDAYDGEYKDLIQNVARPIVQYTLAGKKLMKFSSANEAAGSTGFTASTLLACAHKKTKVSHGFVWRFEGDRYKGEYANYKIGKPVTQYSVNGKKIRTFPTISSAAKATGLTSDNIQKNLHGENHTAGGFVWRFATNKDIANIKLQREVKQDRPIKYPGKVVIQYSVDGQKVDEYQTISDAAKACKIRATNISAALDKLRIAGGYVWRTKGSRYNGLLARNPLPNKPRAVTQFNLEGKKLRVFSSTRQAQRVTGVSSSTISTVAHGRLKSAGGFIWKFADVKKINQTVRLS